MSLHGVWQLTRLRVGYSGREGSSRAARDFVGNYLPKFRSENPQLEVVVEERKGHPSLHATYCNGIEKEVELRKLDVPEILVRLKFLRNSQGRPPLTKPLNRHVTSRRSLQGRWTPFLFDK